MHLRQSIEFEMDRMLLSEALKKQKGKKVTLTSYERIDFEGEDVYDIEPSDLNSLYFQLREKEKAEFLKLIKEEKLLQIKEETAPTDLAAEAELELLLSFRGKYSLDELKRRLESPVLVTDMAQEGSCKWCFTSDTLSEFLDE